MITAVDTNVLAEVFAGGPRARAALEALAEHARQGSLVTCAVVWAELLVGAPSRGALDAALTGMRIEVDWRVQKEVWEEAARRWNQYLIRRKLREPYPCPSCGHRNDLRCSACGERLAGARRMLNDFLIGAHALLHTDGLITWDRGIYGTYFPTLTVRRP